VREAALNLDPLHRALAVSYYGETAVRELETADPRSDVRSGLTALEQISIELYERAFLALHENQQTELISSINAQPQSLLRRFYEVVRGEAIRAYYTSGTGLRELDYKGNRYYGTSPGCERR